MLVLSNKSRKQELEIQLISHKAKNWFGYSWQEYLNFVTRDSGNVMYEKANEYINLATPP